MRRVGSQLSGYLYLQGNALSGDIPLFLFTLPNVIHINLAQNKFSGLIPVNVNWATRLATLYLEDNQLTGSLPEIKIPLQQFNGSIPDPLSGLPKTAFEGNSLCGKLLAACSVAGNGTDANGKGKKDKLSAGAIARIVIACVFGLVLLLLILFCLCRNKKENNVESRNIEAAAATVPTSSSAKETSAVANVPPPPVASSENGAPVSKDLTFFVKSFGQFDLDGLLKASAKVLGKGTLGSSYKASFDNGLVVVAVKRLRDVVVPEKEFREKNAGSWIN